MFGLSADEMPLHTKQKIIPAIAICSMQLSNMQSIFILRLLR